MAAAPTTGFAELDDVLLELTDRAADVLRDDFVGAYLQGSFALGDADRHSDCDFLIPVRRPPTPAQEAGLRALHDELPTRPGHWNRHLEGSYPPVEQLRSLDALGAEWLFINHGHRQMEWSTHCNNEWVRWSLRERGVRLRGPDVRQLVDEVPADALRARMRVTIPRLMADLQTWLSFERAWDQRYAVATCSRQLATLATGQVYSKRQALVWGQRHLDPRWRALLARVLDDRDRGFSVDDLPRPGSLEAMHAFFDYAVRWAAER